ncbi:unnamed protein product [Urochloa decumbens]|uniref:Uncharacterized protein n=1 Tax=Urochloa decumbens TaxID=240449 RepID=A0ABC8VHS4_9POAL
MKRRWRSKSRKSGGSSSPSRSGRPASPNRSGETASSYASADLDREGGDERMEHRRSQGADGLPSPGEETAARPNTRRKKERLKWGETAGLCVYIPTRIMSKFRGDVGAAVKAYIEEGNAPEVLKAYMARLEEEKANALAALKGTKEESIKQNDDAQEEAHSGSSCSSSQSGDAQEEAPFDGEEASLRLKMGNKPEQSYSRDCGKIAQDEDKGGHSGKKTTPAVEDEQHSDKIGVHAIEEHKQEQGSASGHVQALLDMDAKTVREKILYFFRRLNYTPDSGDYIPEYDQEQLIQLAEQLAFYRIRAYELTVDSKLADLSDEHLKLQYPGSKLYDNCYFKYYEESLEWYFDPQRCRSGRFDNYQRLVLHHYRGYLDWDYYRSILNTYEEDLAYVQYFEEVANKTEWIEDYLGGGKIKWQRIRSLALIQALEIAAGFPNVSRLLVTYGFQEYIHSIKCDHSSKGLDDLHFEIWKRVAKGKMSFKEALLEIDIKDLFPSRSFEIKRELENNPGSSKIKDYYDARVAVIDKMASDDKARKLIREVIRESVSKPKYYLDYARKKLDIANAIELVPKGRRRVVAPQGKGGNGKAKVQMDD